MSDRDITMDVMSPSARVMVLLEEEPCVCGSVRVSMVIGTRMSDGNPTFMWDRKRPHDIPDDASPVERRRAMAHKPEYVAIDRPLDVTCCPQCDGPLSWMTPADYIESGMIVEGR